MYAYPMSIIHSMKRWLKTETPNINNFMMKFNLISHLLFITKTCMQFNNIHSIFWLIITNPRSKPIRTKHFFYSKKIIQHHNGCPDHCFHLLVERNIFLFIFPFQLILFCFVIFFFCSKRWNILIIKIELYIRLPVR